MAKEDHGKKEDPEELRRFEDLADRLGIEPPDDFISKEPRAGGKIKRNQVVKLIRFAIKHDFVISPAGAGYYIDSYNMFNYCPCDPERKSCPCPESIEEVKINGKCLCHLFWRDYETYLEEKLNVKKEN